VAIQALVEFDGGGKAGNKGIDWLAGGRPRIGWFFQCSWASLGWCAKTGWPRRGGRQDGKCADNNRLAGKFAASLCRWAQLGCSRAMLRRSQFYRGGRISVLYFARSQLSILLLGRVTRKLRR